MEERNKPVEVIVPVKEQELPKKNIRRYIALDSNDIKLLIDDYRSALRKEVSKSYKQNLRDKIEELENEMGLRHEKINNNKKD